MNAFQDARRIVVKVGTSTLTHETGMANLRRLEGLIRTLADLVNSGRELVLVSSGAIAVGKGKLGLRERPGDTPTRQAAAAVGQCELMYLYDQMFAGYNHTVAQLLLTKDVVEDEVKRRNVTNTFGRLFELGAIPVVNENDTVATDELEGENIGDNDTLSATVATLVEADALILLSDIDGLYDRDPRQHPDARLIPAVDAIDDELLAIASGTGSNRGTGGMVTKLHAARIATEAGIDMAILNGANPKLLYDLFDGRAVGTHFRARRAGR